MDRKEDINSLIEVADELFDKIKKEYKESLKKQTLNPKIAVYIKNYLENLRSPLDYIANEIVDNVLHTQPARAYFPISSTDPDDFETYANRHLPGLKEADPALYDTLEQMQPYHLSGCKSLFKLFNLVNSNKHSHLSPQKEEIKKGLNIEFPSGAAIKMGHGASIRGGGIIRSGNSWFSPGGGTISGDNPIQVGDGIKQTVIIWKSFIFEDSSDEVLTLLDQCRKDVKKIIQEVSDLLW